MSVDSGNTRPDSKPARTTRSAAGERGTGDGGKADANEKPRAALALAALGVVYGDIGTSPLYAFREALRYASPAIGDVLGILSLVFWALVVVVTIKYLLFAMAFDNRGEGGILALLASLNPWQRRDRLKYRALIALGVFGAALLYGDGMITPAISVLSAVEGLGARAPGITPLIIPITVAILIALFYMQRHGTGAIGAVFGPVMLVWFGVLGALGLAQIAHDPSVLAALDPRWGWRFLIDSGANGLVVVGAVFLAVTGGEALYADMGHFGRAPIRLAWFAVALPCLVANYFGQGALVLADPSAALNPFYQLAPDWLGYPLIILAAMATVIASQAVISGVFSLTRQAVQLEQCPRLIILQTSSEEIGQVYVPAMNLFLALSTIGLVLAFRSSANLAAAYGVAVATTMVLTTILALFALRERRHWPWAGALALAAVFLVIDLAFLWGNVLKILSGGWLPLTVAVVLYLVANTWQRGRRLLFARTALAIKPLNSFFSDLAATPPVRVPGTAVFLTALLPGTPPMLRHHLARNQALHEQVVFLTVMTEDVPRIGANERIEASELAPGFYWLVVRYGFMQNPDVPVALRLAQRGGLDIDLEQTTYYVGRENLIPSRGGARMNIWRKRLFAFLSRNATSATRFFDLPAERVVELGLQVKL